MAGDAKRGARMGCRRVERGLGSYEKRRTVDDLSGLGKDFLFDVKHPVR